MKPDPRTASQTVAARRERAQAALSHFVSTPLEELVSEGLADPDARAIRLVADAAATVPAYRRFLAGRDVDPASVCTVDDFRRLPLVTKPDYVRAFPLAERCRGGTLDEVETLALSSGSTGEPTAWPRSLADELAVAPRFEQVFHDAFEADRRSTLAVVCFPLGTWVGGMFTAACLRLLAAKGYPVTTLTPGNQKAEILRVVLNLAPAFSQTVLLGYPPFLKDVIDAGLAAGIRWADLHPKLVGAGEVFSEEWRELVASRTGMTNPALDTASLYGTADAGVLGVETPLTVVIRRFLSGRPDAARALFGEARLPTLVQYDPGTRFFESHEGTLVFTCDGVAPLVRYNLSDKGGVVEHQAMLDRLRELGFDAPAAAKAAGARVVRPMPFVYVFGRSHFAVSFYGANVFPEMISIGLEQPSLAAWVTGKFVVAVEDDPQGDRSLTLAVELAQGQTEAKGMAEAIARSVREALRRLSSEFCHYVPEERQTPRVTLWPTGHPDYFPVGVKHRYSRT